MYTISSYGKMIAPGPRVEAYATALRQVVKPDSVVVDLGSGPGFFALLACKLGARRVYAIEPDASLELARTLAIANGFSDRLICVEGFSNRVSLPERADVVVSDLRGILPLFQQHLPVIVDARRRLLRPGGTLIPRRDSLWVALVDTPEKYKELTAVWCPDYYDLDLAAGRRVVTNTWSNLRVTPSQLLVEPKRWAEIDYYEVETPDVRGEVHWEITQRRTAHGIAIWFDTELAECVGFSNHPASPGLIYSNAFLPFSDPINLAEGDEVKLTIVADLVGDDYVWRWNTEVMAPGQRCKASYQQSSFFSVPLSARQLRKRTATFSPLPNEEAQVIKVVLDLMDGRNSLQDIANDLLKRFPARYASQHTALREVSELSEKYGDD